MFFLDRIPADVSWRARLLVALLALLLACGAVATDSATPAPAAPPRMVLRELAFSGNTVISTAQLTAVASPLPPL